MKIILTVTKLHSNCYRTMNKGRAEIVIYSQMPRQQPIEHQRFSYDARITAADQREFDADIPDEALVYAQVITRDICRVELNTTDGYEVIPRRTFARSP